MMMVMMMMIQACQLFKKLGGFQKVWLLSLLGSQFWFCKGLPSLDFHFLGIWILEAERLIHFKQPPNNNNNNHNKSKKWKWLKADRIANFLLRRRRRREAEQASPPLLILLSRLKMWEANLGKSKGFWWNKIWSNPCLCTAWKSLTGTCKLSDV